MVDNPLGAVGSWPERLAGSVDAMLSAPQLSSLVFGADRTLLYNDSAAAVYGGRHPSVLGLPLARAFPNEFSSVAGAYDRVFAGESLHVPGQQLGSAESGAPRLFDAYLTPIRDAGGRVIAAHMTGFAVDARRSGKAVAEGFGASADTTLHKRTEDALQKSGEIYHTLFQLIDEGFAVIEFLEEGHGCSPDFRFLEVNEAFEQQTGNRNAAGKLGSEVNPGPDAVWIREFGAVVRTGEPTRLEIYHEKTRRWYDVFATRVGGPGSRQVCVVFTDSTERREREDRQAFLLRLSDAIRTESEEGAIGALVAHALSEHLHLDRCYFAWLYPEEDRVVVGPEHRRADLAPAIGEYRLSDFPEVVRRVQSQTVVLEDVAGDAALTESDRVGLGAIDIGAFVTAGVRRGDERVLWALVVVSTTSRAWTSAEVALVEQIAERTWAAIERGRAEAALRESEERHRSLFETISQGFSLAEVVRDAAGAAVDWRLLEMNPVFEDYAGMTVAFCVGRTATDVFGAADPHWLAVYDRVVRSRKAERKEAWFGPINRWVGVDVYPGTGDRFTVLYEDISERKRTEAALQKSEERQMFLLKLSDALRPLSDPEAVLAQALRVLGKHLEVSRVIFAERDGDEFIVSREFVNGVPSMIGRFPKEAFGQYTSEVYNQSGRAVIYDAPADPTLSDQEKARFSAAHIASYATTVLHKEDGVSIALAAHHNVPRDWTNTDFELIEETAERTWAAVERARAEVALRESEERFRALSDALPALAWRNDAAGDNLFVNRHFLEFTGKTADEISNAGWRSIIHPEDADEYIGSYLAAVQARRGHRGRGRYLRHDGAWRWHEYQTQALWSADGEYAGDIGVSLDVSEQTEAEGALRRSEERLRQFGEASQDILWIRDATTLQWTYLTAAFEAIYGLSREEALAGDNYRTWQDLIVPEDRDRAVTAIARVGAGEHVTFEYRVRRPSDGTIRWLRNTDFPITDDEGNVRLIGGVGHDVTRMKEIESEVAASEERLRLLMEGIPQLVWRSCDKGRWTWSSPQWQDFTGQSQDQSHGMGWLDAIHPDDRAAAMRAWEEARPHGRLDVEYRVHRAADNAWIWHHTRSVPVYGRAGLIVEWLGTSTDIHELRELQGRQKVLVAELQHRTRNLMGVVRSVADKTAKASSDLPDFRHRFRDRLDALSRVQGLLSRMNDHDRVTFDELVDTELAAMDGSADRVTVDGPHGVRLRSSTVQTLAMALHELATNAMKYGALGQSSGRLAITWRLERREDSRKPWLHIDWRESNVAMPSLNDAPTGTGQGRELIERALPYQLRAKTSYKLGPDGVHCTISIPVSASAVEVEEHA